MEIIVNILVTFFSGYWLWLSIPTCIFLFFYIIHLLIIGARKRKMKTWRIGDIIYIKFSESNFNDIYNAAKKASSVDEPRARLLKWNVDESLIVIANGTEYFIETNKINNRTAYNRVRESKMEEFMEDNNGIKNKAERREDAIDSIIGESNSNV